MKKRFNKTTSNLEDLSPEVREKALEIATELIEQRGIDPNQALIEGIRQAKEWFIELEG